VPAAWSAAEGDREWDRDGAQIGVSRLSSTMDLAYPFEGRWLTQNSPANRVPSHGTALFATTFAIDFVPVGQQHRTACSPSGHRSLGRATRLRCAHHPRRQPAPRWRDHRRGVEAPLHALANASASSCVTSPPAGARPATEPADAASLVWGSTSVGERAAPLGSRAPRWCSGTALSTLHAGCSVATCVWHLPIQFRPPQRVALHQPGIRSSSYRSQERQDGCKCD
jgi:hypothetical protein